ncbi:hypothetical protein NIES4101_68060 [Calothrix sp. NIES-4101]|nr:hypothetical protein NIES4101_68060 [Calothrix sp. NIES-4101]
MRPYEERFSSIGATYPSSGMGFSIYLYVPYVNKKLTTNKIIVAVFFTNATRVNTGLYGYGEDNQFRIT